MPKQAQYTCFANHEIFCTGTLTEVVLKVKRQIDKKSQDTYLIFSDESGKSMDFNFQGKDSEVLKRLEVFTPIESEQANGPGRPRLGVVSREVSLLPAHWEWLATQAGGASVTLRRLVDEARKKSSQKPNVKVVQEKVYRFLSVIAGDLPHYEEALRALYRQDKAKYLHEMSSWPPDIKTYSLLLAEGAF